MQILDGLEHLHINTIIHRDIKGANIMVDADGVCKLGDFGCAKKIAGLNSDFKSLKGTPNWMAPEVPNFLIKKRLSNNNIMGEQLTFGLLVVL